METYPVRRARRLRPRAGRGLMATAFSPYVGYQMTVRREVLVAVVARV